MFKFDSHAISLVLFDLSIIQSPKGAHHAQAKSSTYYKLPHQLVRRCDFATRICTTQSLLDRADLARALIKNHTQQKTICCGTVWPTLRLRLIWRWHTLGFHQHASIWWSRCYCLHAFYFFIYFIICVFHCVT